MKPIQKINPLVVLLTGDFLVLVVGTLVGFASHGKLTSTSPLRMLTTFLPVGLSWALAAPFLGLYRLEIAATNRQLWRPWLAMLFAAPLAGVLRGLWLGTPILPVFVAVLAASFGLGFFIWRFLFWQWVRKQVRYG